MTAPVLAISASELTDLHRQIDTLAMVQPESLPAIRTLVDELVWQALMTIARRRPRTNGV
jgi:hypothetical protein